MDTGVYQAGGGTPGAAAEFAPGSDVIYSVHGRCQVKAIEERTVGGQRLRFYRLEPQRSALSRSTRPEPAIWLPVMNANQRGLRCLMNKEQCQQAFEILTDGEYYFALQNAWNHTQSELEACLAIEGGIGLAKVLGFLHVLKARRIVPPSDVIRMFELVHRLLVRELVEVLGEPVKTIEERVEKALRQKLKPDS